MKKFLCVALFITASCFADEGVEEDFPHYEDEAQKAFMVTVTQHIHAYKNEDKLMMEKKSEAVKPLAPPKQGPRNVKVKMEVNPKKKRFQLTAKAPF